MKNLKFRYGSATNFLPFGPEGIELFFDKYKNIVLIRGENKDAKQIDSDTLFTSEECRVSSNGTGKSSLQEIIVYGLYGKTVKRPEKLGVNDVVHNKVGRDCKVELIFDEYRIVRTRLENGKTNSLRLWHSDKDIWDSSTEITQGEMKATQKRIDEIVGLSYEAFVNMCIFTDDQRACFLECDNKQKKEIVENLLSLGIVREWNENAKLLKKEMNANISSKSKEYQLLLGNEDDAKRRLKLTEEKNSNWKTNKQNEIISLKNNIKEKSSKLGVTDNGKALLLYREAQEKIKEINDLLPKFEESKAEVNKKLSLAREKDSEQKSEAKDLNKQYEAFSSDARTKLADRKKKEAEIADLESKKPGSKCNSCKGLVEEENIASYIEDVKRDINNLNLDIQASVLNGKEIAAKSEDLKKRQEKVAAFIRQFEGKIAEIDAQVSKHQKELIEASKVREPKADSAELLLEQQIAELQKQVSDKEAELANRSPFQDILDNDRLELETISANVVIKDKEVKELEATIPYFDYWLNGFGEHGIRKWVVDGIIPDLNNRINYWLQYLIDNKITLKFDAELSEKIERNPVDGDPYIYHAMSTGQRRRLNLAVSQSFAYIMSMSSDFIPSIIFLDEVSTNVDPLGVQGIYNMICELSTEKQVFVTTHDPDLLRMLQGADVINLVHENGYTKLVP